MKRVIDKNFNITIGNLAKVFFIFFLFLFSFKVNFQQYFPGRYLFVASLLINIFIFWLLRKQGKDNYKIYLFLSILIFNFFFDEEFLITNYGFKNIFSYPYSLLISVLLPIFLLDVKRVRLLLKNQSIKIFLTITFYSVSIDFSDYLKNFDLLKNIEFFIFVIFSIYLFNMKNIENKNSIYLFLVLKFYFSTIAIILAYLYFIQLNSKKLNEYKYYFPFLLIFVFSSLNSFYHTTKSNIDNYIFFIGGLKSNLFNLEVYDTTLDIKGFILYEIFKISSKIILFMEINQWFIFIFLILIILFVTNFCIYKLLSAESTNPEIIIFIQFFITQDLLFDSYETRVGARIIGSVFLLLSIYFLHLEKYYYSSLFLLSSIFTLISFIIPAFIIFIYITVLKLKNYKNYCLYMFLNIGLFIFYLIITNQLYKYYTLNLDFIFNYNSGHYSKIPTFGFLNMFILMLVPIFLISLKFDFKLFEFKKLNLPSLALVWFIGELLHLYLSEARFDHYKNLLIIPVYLLLGIIISKESKFDFKKIFIVLIVIFLGYSNFNSSTNYEVRQTSLTFKDIEINKHAAKKDFSYGIFISKLDPNIYYHFFEVNSIIQAPRSWLLFEYPRTYNFNENEIFTFFIEDIKRYNPSVVVVARDFELENSYHFIQNFIADLEISKCNDTYCTYVFKNNF